MTIVSISNDSHKNILVFFLYNYDKLEHKWAELLNAKNSKLRICMELIKQLIYLLKQLIYFLRGGGGLEVDLKHCAKSGKVAMHSA